MYRYLLFILLAFSSSITAQTVGGNAVFNFLSQSNGAQLSALGGVNVSAMGNDVSMSFHNPALLRNEMNQQVSTSFNAFLAGVKNYSLTTAFYLPTINTNLGVGVNYFDYGSITQTDAAGNIFGSFRPADYVVQATLSKQYHERWWYGITGKFINSNYGQYRSSGLAFDIGLAYHDSSRQMQVSLVAKNMGTQLGTYDGSNRKEELPFDLQAGITKRLADAPFQFSLTAHHLHRFDIFYNDTTFRASEGDDRFAGSNTAGKILSHLVLSAQIFLNDKLEIITGYNFIRRQELNVFNVTNGMNGFTLGATVKLRKLHIHYATGFYQSNMFHQLSLNLNWKGEML